MSLDLNLVNKFLKQPCDLGPGRDIISYLGINTQSQLNKRGRDKFDESYRNYCVSYIDEYMELINSLHYGLFMNNNFFNGIIRPEDRESFFQKYADIFTKMFNLNNIEEMLYGDPKLLLKRCNADRINIYENNHSTELEALKKIIHLANINNNNYEENDDY
tara:strand:- start:39 stop:521 length:483 start_codon:yes stop_codon:yes gene_type:complete